MKAIITRELEPGHVLEYGPSSFDPNVMTVRNRYDNQGRFSPHASSELTLTDLGAVLRFALEVLDHTTPPPVG